MSYLRPRIQAKLDGMAARQQELMARAANPAEPPERLAPIQRELGAMTRVIADYEAYRQLLQQVEDNKALLGADGDPELAELAREELPELDAAAKALAGRLIDQLLRETGDNRRNCIVEIRAGTGGEEAALFARDLTEVYQRYAARMRWKIEPMHTAEADQGGYKEVVFALRGEDVFHFMRFESGGHRVQRVPDTEAKGRVHTSAATVAVLPEVGDIEIHVDEKDLRVDTYRSSGAGGQHVNKTDSAVRITHLPSGVVVACQDERSQHKNRARAMKMLRARLYEAQQRAQQEARAAHRKDQVGSGDRSERVRTYNFPQDRLTDPRLQRNFSLSQIMEGRLDPGGEALLADDRERRLEEL